MDLPERVKAGLFQVKLITGLEQAPFLQQFKGQNGVHEGDREKASSIVKNLVYKPASELGKFKFIFSKQLREKYFTNLEKKKIKIEKGDKIELGQVSKEEMEGYFREQGYKQLVDVLWSR